MGKSFKKRFMCCWTESSSDTKDECIDGREIDTSVPTKSIQKSKKPTKIENLKQEIAELEQKLKSIESRYKAFEEKHRTTEREIGTLCSESVAEKMVEKFAYASPPLMVYSKKKLDSEVNISTSFPPPIEVTDVNRNRIATESTTTSNLYDASTNDEYKVTALACYCRSMFFREVTSDENRQCYRRYATDFATHYINNAMNNVKENVHMRNRNDQHIPLLRKMCYGLLVIENVANQQEGDVKRLPCTDVAFELSGKFGQADGIGCGLARGRRLLKEKNFLDVSGLSNVIQPLQSMQALLHHEIMTTLNFSFRVTLRDIMLKNKFDESYAKFLCINMLISIKHLHSLNMIHGHISPSKMMFTQYGYPCLTGVDYFQKDDDTYRPSARIEYTSPEQVNHEQVTEATDIFQTGILVYSMVYGKSPFKADTFYKTKANILDETFTPAFEPETFSKDGRYFVRKLLKTNPTDRFKLDKCRKPLDKAVKWFNSFNQDELFNQTYPSPFKGSLMKEILAG